jgi:hypothetical protein
MHGGIKLQGGPDSNYDGSPDSITVTRYVCNGSPGQSRAIKNEAEPAGVNCPNGGRKITTGDDNDNDGVPDTNLVVTYVCNGEDGNDGPVGPPGATGPTGPTGPTPAASTIIPSLTIPSCFTSVITPGMNLNQYLVAIMNAICNTAPSPITSFHVTDTLLLDEGIAMGTGDTFRLHFDDETTGLNFDTGNNHDITAGWFIAPVAMTATFEISGLILEWAAGVNPAGSNVRLQMMLDGNEVGFDFVTGASWTADADGDYHTMNTISVPLTLTAGQKVYCQVKMVTQPSSGPDDLHIKSTSVPIFKNV